jgi:hypothetical protein
MRQLLCALTVSVIALAGAGGATPVPLVTPAVSGHNVDPSSGEAVRAIYAACQRRSWTANGDCDSDYILHSTVRVAEVDDPKDGSQLYSVIFDHISARPMLDDDIMTFIHRPMHPSNLPVLKVAVGATNGVTASREKISIDLLPCSDGGLHPLQAAVNGQGVKLIAAVDHGSWSRLVLPANPGLDFIELWNTRCDVWEYVPVVPGRDRHVVVRMEARSDIGPDSAVNYVQAPNALIGTLPDLPGLGVSLCREDDLTVCTDAVVDSGAYVVTYAFPQYRYALVLHGDDWSRTIGLVDLRTQGYEPHIARHDITLAEATSDTRVALNER